MEKIALLIPVFLLIAGAEWMFTRKKNPGGFTGENTLLNICIGAVDRILSIASFALFILVLKLVYDNFRLWTPAITWYHWVLAYLAVDFVSYWYHRLSHRIALLWCGHVTHHSSDHYNLTNSFRTSPFQGLYRIPFWIVLPVLGFSPEVLVTVFIISGLYDFFLHLHYFPKYRFVELIFVTPSLHKVHHGKNDVYIDKNYGATFIFWDRMFGTFQDETVELSYGILSEDYKDGDPVNAIFHHFRYLIALTKTTSSRKNKVKLWLMPPDWVPEDNPPPVSSDLNVNTPGSVNAKLYALSVFCTAGVGVILMLILEKSMDLVQFIIYASFLLTSMISGTRIFNGRSGNSFRSRELIRNIAFAILFLAVAMYPGLNPSLAWLVAMPVSFALWSATLIVESANGN